MTTGPRRPQEGWSTMTTMQCPVSLGAFLAKAGPLTVTLTDAHGRSVSLAADPRAFSTGSFGWYAGGKGTLSLETRERCAVAQVGVTVTLVASKGAPRS